MDCKHVSKTENDWISLSIFEQLDALGALPSRPHRTDHLSHQIKLNYGLKALIIFTMLRLSISAKPSTAVGTIEHTELAQWILLSYPISHIPESEPSQARGNQGGSIPARQPVTLAVLKSALITRDEQLPLTM